MTEQNPIKPAQPHFPLQPLPDWLFWDAGMGGFFICYDVDLLLQLYREKQTKQAEAPEVMPA